MSSIPSIGNKHPNNNGVVSGRPNKVAKNEPGTSATDVKIDDIAPAVISQSARPLGAGPSAASQQNEGIAMPTLESVPALPLGHAPRASSVANGPLASSIPAPQRLPIYLQSHTFFSNRTVYNGYMLNGLPQGFGTKYTFQGMREAKGTWNKGDLVYGSAYSLITGIKLYKGGWQNGKWHGHGKCNRPVDGTIEYEGNWQNGKRHGQGQCYYPNGTLKYDGNWQDNKAHGQGQSYHPNGTLLYDGNWQDNKAHGQGKTYRPDGTVEYEGNWQDNKRHGQGTEYNANGTVLRRGIFQNGKFIGPA